MLFQISRFGEILLEDRPEGMAVGDAEEAERTYQHVKIDRVCVLPEDALLPAAPDDVADDLDDRDVEVLDRFGRRQIFRPVDVLCLLYTSDAADEL